MDTDTYSPSPLQRPMVLPSIHLHPSLSSAPHHQQAYTQVAPHAIPSPINSVTERREFETPSRPSPSASSAYRTTSRASTASSVDENSDEERDHPANRHSRPRHHPYKSHHSTQGRPPLSVSSSLPRRGSIYSAYSQSHDDMRALLGPSASASASADEGSNSNSYYDGDSPVASHSTTSSPIFTFVPGGQANSQHSHGMPDGSPSAGRPGIGAGSGNGGGQSAAPLSLDSLPSYPPDQKPPFSYPVLIRLAILGSPQKRLLLSQIYSAIEEKFPWYRDSAPKAWKASVRHCLSLNKEFVRMQRAVEDPGVGCGGWWSVGEGMKGLKRPRKRRPAQSRRHEHELDPTPIIKTPTPSPLTIRRRHSTTFEDALTEDPYSRYVSSSSLPPSVIDAQRGAAMKERGDVPLRPIDEYSLRLPPLHMPNAANAQSTPPFSSRTGMYDMLGSGRDIDGEIKTQYTHGRLFNSTYGRPRGTHTPTASSSSSYSNQSYGSASSASSSSRPNPMSISNLLNERDPSNTYAGAGAGGLTERLDKMDIDIKVEPHSRPGHGTFAAVQSKAERDVEMRPKVETPFSSDQTLRPPSPCSTSPQSHGRRSTTPVAPTPRSTTTEQRHRDRVPHGDARPSSRPPSRTRGHAERTTPAKPTRPPPPVPISSHSRGSTATRERERKSGRSTKSTTSAGASKPWASSMDLSLMEPESEFA